MRAQRLTASTYSSPHLLQFFLEFVGKCSTPDGINVFVTRKLIHSGPDYESCSTPDGINVFVTRPLPAIRFQRQSAQRLTASTYSSRFRNRSTTSSVPCAQRLTASTYSSLAKLVIPYCYEAMRAQRLTASTYSSLVYLAFYRGQVGACSTPDGINVFVTASFPARFTARL